MKIDIYRLECLRCGHTWVPRQADVRLCPKCKSPFWDTPKEELNANKAGVGSSRGFGV